MFKELLKKLGLADTATEAEAVAKVTELQTSLNSQQVSLANFVPREDYNVAVNRAATLEAQIKTQAEAAHKTEAEAAIEAALKGGKISPATKDFYVATCASAEGLAQFKKFAETAPSVFAESGLARKPVPGADDVALNTEQEAGLAAFGLTREQYVAALPKKA